MILKPDPDPDWPGLKTFGALLVAALVLVIYAYTLRPFGFIVPTAFAAAILSFQIAPNLRAAVITGAALSVGLFVLFKFALGLGLVAFPKGLIG
jgi:putative tricarboxylic transport membrane protein